MMKRGRIGKEEYRRGKEENSMGKEEYRRGIEKENRREEDCKGKNRTEDILGR